MIRLNRTPEKSVTLLGGTPPRSKDALSGGFFYSISFSKNFFALPENFVYTDPTLVFNFFILRVWER